MANCKSKVIKVRKTMNYEIYSLMNELYFARQGKNNHPFIGKLLQEQAIIYSEESEFRRFDYDQLSSPASAHTMAVSYTHITIGGFCIEIQQFSDVGCCAQVP